MSNNVYGRLGGDPALGACGAIAGFVLCAKTRKGEKTGEVSLPGMQTPRYVFFKP